jgi:UDP-N-acetylglucosamine 3-dehydrogenase
MNLGVGKSFLIARTILECESFTQLELSTRTKVSLGQVHKVVSWLEKRGVVRQAGSKFVLIDREKLLAIISVFRSMYDHCNAELNVGMGVQELLEKLPKEAVLCLDSAAAVLSNLEEGETNVLSIYLSKEMKVYEEFISYLKSRTGNETKVLVFEPDVELQVQKYKWLTTTTPTQLVVDYYCANMETKGRALYYSLSGSVLSGMDSNDKLRVAVVGVGEMGYNHVRNYAEMPGVQLVAVCDTNRERVKQVAKRFKVKAYGDANHMFAAEKLDAVSVAVPTKLHAEVALAAISHGINVLVEKPIADNERNARKIMDAANRAGVKLMVGHIERFNPAVERALELVAHGTIGQVIHVAAQRKGPFPPRIADSGVTVDLAVHDIDVMLTLARLEHTGLQRVFCECSQHIHPTHEDIMRATLRFSNGAIATLEVDWLTPVKVRKLFIGGSKGAIIVDYITQGLELYVGDLKRKKLAYDYMQILGGVQVGEKRFVTVSKEEPLRKELSHFLDCVKSDGEPRVKPEHALEALKVARMMLKSAERGKPIKVR